MSTPQPLDRAGFRKRLIALQLSYVGVPNAGPEDPYYRDAARGADELLATLPGSSTAPDLREAVARLERNAFHRLRKYLENGPTPEVNAENLAHLEVLRAAMVRQGDQGVAAAGSSTEAGGLREAAEYLLSELERPTGLRADQDSPIAQWFRGVINAAEMLRSALAVVPQYHGNDPAEGPYSPEAIIAREIQREGGVDDTEALNYATLILAELKVQGFEVRRLRAHGNDLEAAAKRSYEILSAWFARQRPIDQAAGTGTMIKVIIKELGDALSLRAQGGDAGAGA